MRKSITLAVLFVLTAATVFAGHKDSDLKITAFQNQIIKVKIDGSYWTQPTTKVVLKDVRPGRRHIEVISVGPRFNRKIYSGNVYIRAESLIRANINPHGKFIVKKIEAKPHQHYNGCGCESGTISSGYPAQQTACHGNCNGCGLSGCNWNGGGTDAYGHYSGYSAEPTLLPIHNSDFNRLIRTLEGQRFDNARVSIAVKAFEINAFSSNQVRRILNTISFENNRLDVAKASYASVIDPQNFHLVTDAFRFQSSINRLYDYIGV
ncbi:MAG: hypothetical protein ACI959_000485 [Limisphaerales bacterium]|jgi:hypothetical protein